MSEYLIVISATDKRGLSQVEEQHCIAEYGKWAQLLAEKHVAARRLDLSEGTHLPSKKTPNTDGPFAEAKELIAGVIIVEAESQEAADKIAMTCPLREYFQLYVKKVSS